MATNRVRLSAALLALGFVLSACTSTAAPGAMDLGTGLGPLPAASFSVLGDDATQVSVEDWQGTPTVVNFWATWCAFCVEELPELQAAHELLGAGVRFVGIDRQDPTDAALSFLADAGVSYDQLASPDGSYYTKVGARGMPTTLFVDAAGVVTYRHTGPLERQLVLDLVAEHLGVTP